MSRLKNKFKLILSTLVFLMLVTTGVLVIATDSSSDDATSSYVELYSPLNEVDINMSNPTYFKASVEDTELTLSGKGLVLDYIAGGSNPVTVTIPTNAATSKDFKGLALWVDVPSTADSYSFTLYLENVSQVWQTMNFGTRLTLVPENGDIYDVNSIWKRQELNGFRGWVLMPMEAYDDSIPNDNGLYNFIFMIENELSEGFFRTEDIEITIGSIGYYTDYTSVLYEFAGTDAMEAKTITDLENYINEAYALKPKNADQTRIKNEMLVYFSNYREHFEDLSVSDQIEITKELYNNYYAFMEDYLYGEIRKTDLIMSFALMSDTHFTQKWNNERFQLALEDAKAQKPDLSAAIVLGDLSDNGVSATNEEHTELDNYYEWIDSYEYKDINGNQIPIYNVMGNHDVRGHYTLNYPESSYQPAIDMYLEREKLAKEANSIQFDTWINGYHFIFLNTDKYHSDDCYLNADTINWLDETLSENEDGRPIFVMVHQPKDKVHVMEGASMTFEEVIAKHPSAIVSSGHEHAPFGNAKITQEGNGVFINQPAMVNVAAQYYIAEVYEGGVIYRAREASTESWVISSDVVVANEDMINNVVLSSDTLDLAKIVESNADISHISYDSVSGSAIKITANSTSGEVSIPVGARGEMSNYAGYAIYASSETPIKINIDGKGLTSEAKYYLVSSGTLIENSAGSNGEIKVDGWVIIPKTAFSDSIYPNKNSVLNIELSQNQTIYLDQVSYFFDINQFVDKISYLSYCFYNDGEVVSTDNAPYGSSLEEPTNVAREETTQYTYSFIGWDLNGDGIVDELPDKLKGNIIAHAVYEAVVRQYTYTLYAADGETVLVSKTVDYGTKVEEPNIDKLFGWDLDDDGAIEELPNEVIGDFSATAILGVPKYDNADVVFDPSILSEVMFKTFSWGGPSITYSGNSLPVTNNDSPTGKIAQFTYNYKPEHTYGTHVLELSIPYNSVYENFQGYAIWVDIPATGEDYFGGININGHRTDLTTANGFALIDINGNVTYQTSQYANEGIFPTGFANGFTGWIIIDKNSYVNDKITEEMIAPSSSGKLQFRITGGNRTSSYTIKIGEVIVYNDKEAIISELKDKEVETLQYSFTDGTGYIYKAGQIAVGEAIILPENPTYEDSDVIFAGWDTDGDGYPNELPADGIINESIKAVAVFYHVDAFESFEEGTTTNWGIIDGELKMENCDYEKSSTGKAVKLEINKDLKAADQTISYARLTVTPNDKAVGVAFWMDASDSNSFGLRIWKNWIAKGHANDGGDYVYFYGEDDNTLVKAVGWRTVSVPNNFKGWVIIPLTAFNGSETIYPGDFIRLGFAFGLDGNPSDFSGTIYLGEGVTFNCPIDFFINQIDKQVYGFKDWDDSFIAGDVLTDENEFVAPKNPSREGWEFVGWDIDNDGIADELPVSIERNFVAKAIYTKEFTYKFVDQDNNVILEKTTEYNSLVLPPLDYVYNDNYYSYEFEHIDFVDGILLTDNLIFRVNVKKIANKFTVTFIDADGNILQEDILGYGEMPSYNGILPSKPSTIQYSYITKWDKEIGIVTNDITYTLTFEEVLNKYNVIFYNDDQKTILITQEVSYGEVPVYQGEIPSKPSDEKYNYIFAGWNKELSTVTGDVEYFAVYTKEPIDGHYHDFASEHKNDANNHWKECQCGEKESVEAHDYVQIVLKEATETEEGLIEHRCGVCGYSYTESIGKLEASSEGCNGSVTTSLISLLILACVIFVLKKKKSSFFE